MKELRELVEAAKALRVANDWIRVERHYKRYLRIYGEFVHSLPAAEAWMKENKAERERYHRSWEAQKRLADFANGKLNEMRKKENNVARESLGAVREFVDGYCPEHSSQIAQELTVGTIEEIDAQLAKLEALDERS